MSYSFPVPEHMPLGPEHEKSLNALDTLIRPAEAHLHEETKYLELLKTVRLEELLENRSAQSGLYLVLHARNQGAKQLVLKRRVPDTLQQLSNQVQSTSEDIFTETEDITACFDLEDEDGRKYFFLDSSPSVETARLFLEEDQLQVAQHHEGYEVRQQSVRESLAHTIGSLATRFLAENAQAPEHNAGSISGALDIATSLVVDTLVQRATEGEIAPNIYPAITRSTKKRSDVPFTKPLMRVRMSGGKAEFYNYKAKAWQPDPTGLYKPEPPQKPQTKKPASKSKRGLFRR